MVLLIYQYSKFFFYLFLVIQLLVTIDFIDTIIFCKTRSKWFVYQLETPKTTRKDSIIDLSFFIFKSLVYKRIYLYYKMKELNKSKESFYRIFKGYIKLLPKIIFSRTIGLPMLFVDTLIQFLFYNVESKITRRSIYLYFEKIEEVYSNYRIFFTKDGVLLNGPKERKKMIAELFEITGLSRDEIMKQLSERYDSLMSLKNLNKEIPVHGILFEGELSTKKIHPTFSYETLLEEQPKGRLVTSNIPYNLLGQKFLDAPKPLITHYAQTPGVLSTNVEGFIYANYFADKRLTTLDTLLTIYETRNSNQNTYRKELLHDTNLTKYAVTLTEEKNISDMHLKEFLTIVDISNFRLKQAFSLFDEEVLNSKETKDQFLLSIFMYFKI